MKFTTSHASFIFLTILMTALVSTPVRAESPFQATVRLVESLSTARVSQMEGWKFHHGTLLRHNANHLHFEKRIEANLAAGRGTDLTALNIFLNVPSSEPSRVTGKGFAWNLSIIPERPSPGLEWQEIQNALLQNQYRSRVIAETALRNAEIEHSRFIDLGRFGESGVQSATIYFETPEQFQRLLSQFDEAIRLYEVEGIEALAR